MAMDKRTAIFPGSFDPFTLGHMDVLQSALNLFDRIYVAVGYNHLKRGFLSPQTRVRLINDAVRPLVDAGADIEVLSYTGLTVDLCREKGADFIVRGLRTTTDFELEDEPGDSYCLHPGFPCLFVYLIYSGTGCDRQRR